ncbi:hypothetical protein [sulfur-oxidizing endosymbiont of Gigantopelta aegis]|uniref:hypothetical protein n=1 Tax=sulfur-oxidizing endosymbiont of Gigantopelta aegis TaxID=2794934 RepID=UPI0018DE8039|nr:hypothetical protein [sulfur-oxidizing endosymbiont of Gigantopelta aegis]
MPQLEKGSISDIVFDQDNNIYIAAIMHNEDTLFARGELKGLNSKGFDLKDCQLQVDWKSSFICGVKIVQMSLSPWSDNKIYATALCEGVYLLELESIFEQEKIKKEPDWIFSATGHIDFDVKTNQIFATAYHENSDKADNQDNTACNKGFYNSIVVFNREKTSTDNNLLTLVLNVNKENVRGSDGFVLAQTKVKNQGDTLKSVLYIVIDEDEPDGKKSLCRFMPEMITNDKRNTLWLGDKYHSLDNSGRVALKYINYENTNGVLLSRYSMHDLQYIPHDPEKSKLLNIPVQAGPIDLLANADSKKIYVLNYIGQSITVLDYDLQAYEQGRAALGQYRDDVIRAYYALSSGVLQYLKDCFCHHLLVECPECDEDEKVYLGCLSIEDNEINHICNFTKRKYVKSFPTIAYWLSILPIAPLLAWLVEEFCCLILPNFFKQRDPTRASISTESLGLGKAILNANQSNVITELTTQGKELARDSMVKVIGAGYKDKNSYQEVAMLQYTYKPGVINKPIMKGRYDKEIIAKVNAIDMDAIKNKKKIYTLEEKLINLNEEKTLTESRISQVELDKSKAESEVINLKQQVNNLQQEKILADTRFLQLENNLEKFQLEVLPVLEAGKSIEVIEGISNKDKSILTENNVVSVGGLAKMNALELKKMGVKETDAIMMIKNAQGRIEIK